MPWSSSEAKRFTKVAEDRSAGRQWSSIANKALEEGKDDAEAIKLASGVVKSRFKSPRKAAPKGLKR